ncbi:MAG TPA: substrate-binding domain-containing protein [Polyangiaceae bacterium]|nr:substrate-binding domain-containing protein [Polyangiaceae bacterium]
MATKAVLAELLRAYETRTASEIVFESVGGVDAANRIRTGEAFDFAVLARDAIDKLVNEGHLARDSVVDLVRSEVAVAVRSGCDKPDIRNEDALREAVLNAHSIGISTGPSGAELTRLFERWGIALQIKDRIVVPAPGVAVGSLVASGEVELGFQQYPELFRLEGIELLGMLPEPVRIVTTFSAALTTTTRSPRMANQLLAFLASADTLIAKQLHGMQAA